ncbi:MAG: response regulator [Cyclobacteriaceae bacterium]
MTKPAALSVLFIDDDSIERMKFKRTVDSSGLNVSISEVSNGEKALKALHEGALPHVILLDLNMPRINGVEFLKILKSDVSLRHIPIVILTTSKNQRDLLKCFDIGIAGYILKPLKYEEYEERIKTVLSYWSISELIK